MKPINKQPKSENQSPHLSLSSAQSLMAGFVMRPLSPGTGDDGEPHAVRDDQFTKAANDLFKPSWSLQPADRLEIYNKQYWYRVLDSMLEDFPGVHAILGAAKFDAIATAYVKAHPSKTYSLRDLGEKFATFILSCAEFPDVDRICAQQMAAFEWAAIEAFDRKRYPTISPNALTAGDPAALVLVLQPYITLLETDFALDDFALKVDKTSAHHGVSTAQVNRSNQQQKPITPKNKHLYLVIHRLQNSVYYKRIDEEQFRLLTAIQAGLSLGDACEQVAGELSKSKLATFSSRLQKYFSDWMEFGWFADPTSMNKRN